MIRFFNDWNNGWVDFPMIGKRTVSGLARCRGFTVLELLVVIAVISMLAVLIFPVLSGGRKKASRSVCAGNLRQLALANISYAADHGSFVAAAADIWGKNVTRWHGSRRSRSESFDASKGPLSPYLGPHRQVRQCPDFHPETVGFEAGCGGYGYNSYGVGSRSYQVGTFRGSQKGMSPAGILNAAQTVMFADAAFVQAGKLIEYSFAEPVRHLTDAAPPREAYPAMPSIHFRHDGLANVVWADGHVSSEPVSKLGSGVFAQNQIGWFGPDDNSLFDPF